MNKRKAPMKPWIKYCFFGAIALLVLAGVLYAVLYISLDSEFHQYEDYFGDHYSEIFSISDNSDKAEPILKLAKEAFSFVGSEEEAKAQFGLLSRYCCTGASQKYTLDHIVSDFDGGSGYVWVAYTQKIYDAEGSLLCASGSEDKRVLSRWTVEKTDGTWRVTEILEHP